MELNQESKTNSLATETSGQGGNELPPDPELAGGLPRFCFEPDVAESRRVLAWVNSICTW